MNYNDNNYTYTIKWSQPYTGWDNFYDRAIEQQLMTSNFAEARAVIERIMAL